MAGDGTAELYLPLRPGMAYRRCRVGSVQFHGEAPARQGCVWMEHYYFGPFVDPGNLRLLHSPVVVEWRCHGRRHSSRASGHDDVAAISIRDSGLGLENTNPTQILGDTDLAHYP